jgi:hypothetical protein
MTDWRDVFKTGKSMSNEEIKEMLRQYKRTCGCPIDDLNREESRRCYYCDKNMAVDLTKISEAMPEMHCEHSDPMCRACSEQLARDYEEHSKLMDEADAQRAQFESSFSTREDGRDLASELAEAKDGDDSTR